jgi:predicted membrane protein
MKPLLDSGARLLGGITRSRLITICGLISAAVAVIDPGIFEGSPRAKAAVISIGLVASAVGRGLLHGVNFHGRTVRTLAFLLALSPLALLAGCENIAAAAQTSAKAVSITLDEAEAERAAGALDAAGELAITRAAKDANDAIYEGSDQVLKAGQVDGSTAGRLRAGIELFDRLNNAGTLHIKNGKRVENVRTWTRRARAGLEVYDIVKGPGERKPKPLTPEARRRFEAARDDAQRNRDRINQTLARLEGR